MARPKKNTVDYFPHFTNSGRTMFILEGEFGNDGYCFWFKLLEILGSSENHYFDCSNTSSWKFLLAKTRLDSLTANSILDLLSDLEAIDQELWKQKIIWSDNFVRNLFPVYSNRKTELPKKPIYNSNNSISDELLQVETKDKKVSTKKKRQSKVKEVKEEKEVEILNFFESVWKLYPKKIGKHKIDYEQKKILFNIGYEDIERAISNYKKLKGGVELKFIKDGSTFFNGDYEDFLHYEPIEQIEDIPYRRSDRRVNHG